MSNNRWSSMLRNSINTHEIVDNVIITNPLSWAKVTSPEVVVNWNGNWFERSPIRTENTAELNDFT